ncbi:chemotaxis protein CheB [Rapidithrix thailandica]|uniref:protein-glutamate methylesterase n=1 Tax=Rapidithrix thailandica TaxID=413964 RepID=A0AAW9SAY9_9BACT
MSDKYKAVVIGGSAGSFKPVTQILSSVPEDFPLPIFLCLHRLKHVRHGFVEALSIKSNKKIIEPYDKEPIKRGLVYLAPANYHMSIELGNTFALSTEELVNNSRPAIDITLETAAYNYKDKLIGILLSGANKDGAYGMKKIKERGGMTVVQDLEDSMITTMPAAALAITEIDHVFKVEQLIQFFLQLSELYKSKV